MSRIITNVPSMIAQRVLGQNNQMLTTSLERLSTGLRINRGKDDPAGLIASENLRAEKTAISSAISNAERADQVVNIAEGGLIEISGLLNDLEGLVDQAANDAGLSTEEKEANQIQIDTILSTIDRLANSTSFQGIKLLNGTYAYTTTGATTSEFDEVNINSAKIPTDGQIDVTVDIIASAHNGKVLLSGANGSAVVSGTSLTIEVAGADGVQQFTFASGTTAAQVVTAVNTFADVTGVSAATGGSQGVQFIAKELGSSKFASVTKIAGDSAYDDELFTFDHSTDAYNTTGGSAFRNEGVDASIAINGQTATVDGLEARVANASLDVELLINSTQNTDGGSVDLTITGGGATFAITPKLDLAGRASLGIDAVTIGRLGSKKNGFLDALRTGGTSNVVDGNVEKAQKIVRDSIGKVSKLRGRLGAFQTNTVAASIRSLGVALENTAAAESQIRDTDFAAETAELTRSQILVNAATNVLGISNSQPQNVLALLG